MQVLADERWWTRIDEVVVKIPPLGIGLFDEDEFPCATPLLQCFFPSDRDVHVIILLIPDEADAAVLGRESGKDSFAVLMDAADEIAGDPEVEGAVALAGNDVDGDAVVLRHGLIPQ